MNLACRVNGLRIFQDAFGWWAGGVAWWGAYLKNKGVLRDYEPGRSYPPRTLFIEFCRGAALKDQGHVAKQGRCCKLIQADALEGVPRPGIHEKRTHKETHDLLRRFGGRGWEKACMPEDWLK